MVVYRKMSKRLAMPWREQVTYHEMITMSALY